MQGAKKMKVLSMRAGRRRKGRAWRVRGKVGVDMAAVFDVTIPAVRWIW
jgi:hypothetical protein